MAGIESGKAPVDHCCGFVALGLKRSYMSYQLHLLLECRHLPVHPPRHDALQINPILILVKYIEMVLALSLMELTGVGKA